MSVSTSKTYTVVTAEVLRRTYTVTTSGDELRAATLVVAKDYNASGRAG